MSTSSTGLGLPAIQRLLNDLHNASVWIELTALLGCLALAYALARWMAIRARRNDDSEAATESVWFGRRVVDGLMFPLLALVMVYVAKRLLDEANPHVTILALAVPVLTSLAVIRLVARVLTSVFPASPGARTLERGVSWLA